MAVKIGCDNLVYAIMTTEDTVTTAPVYDTITAAPGVMSINVNPNGAVDTLFADDGPMETASTIGKIEVEIQKSELTTDNIVDMLGHNLDANKGIVYGDSDTPPWLALGFRTLKSNGKYRYVWLYKGKFTEPEDNNETKGDSINFQSRTIKGNFAKLNYKVEYVTGKFTRPWKYELDEETTSVNAAAIAKFFDAPLMPSKTATV